MKNYRHRMLSVVLVLAMLLAYVPMQSRAEMTTVVETIDFNSAADAQKLDLYKTSGTGFTVQNGQLVPTGANGEFKAMFPDNDHTIQSVSVELHPVGANGPIYGGLYIGASNPANGQDQINAIYIGVESHFTGWSDALNRVDLVVGQFPSWKEHSRLVSETGAGNALFSGSMKQPLMLRADIVGNRVDITLSLVSNPAKKVTTSFTAGYDLSQGQVGIRSHYNNATYDNLTVAYLGEQENTEIPDTDVVTFETAEDAQKFNLYHSSQGGFAVSDGKLVPTGAAGQFKAIYKDENASFSRVSVDIYPGADGIDGGVYLDVTDADHPVDQISALSILVQSNFTGWSDAPNRTDLVIGTFPQWKELHRTISETGAGNSLFVGGKKEPVNLRVEIEGNRLTITLRLLSNPAKFVSTVYEYTAGNDIALGNVGIRSQFSGASYDNFAVVYEQVEQDKEPDGETPTEPSEPEIVPTDVVDFTGDNGQFAFYHSANGGFAYQDGRLVSTGEAGQNKAIYEDENASFSYVSVDIYPGQKGVNGGLYLDVTDVDHPVDQITGLYVGIEADFPHEGETPWPDAPNRLDLVVGKFPAWQELHRTISEPGAGNALFTGGNREPVKLSVALEGNQLTITVQLLSNPKKFISVTYVYAEGVDMALGNVGIRSQFSDASFDNFCVVYEQVEADKEPDPTPAPPPIDPTELIDFESADQAKRFDLYHSSKGGFQVKDGMLVPTGETGEFKAIYRDGGSTVDGLCVDIFPGESGQINSGVYIGTSTVEHGADMIKGLVIMVESNHSGWDDAVNRIDLVVGRFPVWRELHRYTSETGANNALFAGQKEPLRLQVDIRGKQVQITLSLLSDPDKYVTTVYEFNGATDLSANNVGLRSANNDVRFDNFAVHMIPGGGSADIDPSQVGSGPSGNTGSNTGSNAGNNSTPNTGDSFRPEAVMLFMAMSLFCLVLVCRKRKTQ